jgi:hypothetical protein
MRFYVYAKGKDFYSLTSLIFVLNIPLCGAWGNVVVKALRY